MKKRDLFRKCRPSIPKRENFKALKAFCDEVQWIIQVVNENEYQAAVTFMKPPGSEFQRTVIFPRPNIIVGMFADKKTALIHTGGGSNCSDYVQDAVKAFPKAKFVIGTGICYAFDSEQHKLGDVLVSKQICDLRNLQLKIEGIVDHGQRVDVVKDLQDVFCKDLICDECFPVSEQHISQVSTGQFVSFPFDVQSKEISVKIQKLVPYAIGGDMEGGELLKFQTKKKIEGVIVIKGVTHYANKNSAEEWEFTATLAALHYAESKLYYYNGKIEHYHYYALRRSKTVEQ